MEIASRDLLMATGPIRVVFGRPLVAGACVLSHWHLFSFSGCRQNVATARVVPFYTSATVWSPYRYRILTP